MSCVDEYWGVVRDFGQECQELLRDNLVSYIIFGSLARGEIAIGWSDIDSILAVKENLDEARALFKTFRVFLLFWPLPRA